MLDAWMGAEDSTTVTTPPVRLELKAIHCALLGLVSVRLGRLPELAERARMLFPNTSVGVCGATLTHVIAS